MDENNTNTATTSPWPDDQTLRSAVWDRYHNDASFHAAVDAAVLVTVPDGENRSLTKALRDVATQAAATALVLHEHLIEYGSFPTLKDNK